MYFFSIPVSENSLSQKRASVKKLTSKDLKLLATTNFNLGELYKLKALSKRTEPIEEHTYNNLNFMGPIPSASIPLPSKPSTTDAKVIKFDEPINNKELLEDIIRNEKELLENEEFIEEVESAIM